QPHPTRPGTQGSVCFGANIAAASASESTCHEVADEGGAMIRLHAPLIQARWRVRRKALERKAAQQKDKTFPALSLRIISDSNGLAYCPCVVLLDRNH